MSAEKQDWSKFTADHTFTVELEGYTFTCARPSGTQLVARKVLPPALVLNQVRGAPRAGLNGDRHSVLLNEDAQIALLDAVLIDPKPWSGDFASCPEGHVPVRALGAVRDALVIAILSQVYDTEVVAAASFPSGEGAGADGGSPGDEVGAAALADHGAPGRRVRGRGRADAARRS